VPGRRKRRKRTRRRRKRSAACNLIKEDLAASPEGRFAILLPSNGVLDVVLGPLFNFARKYNNNSIIELTLNLMGNISTDREVQRNMTLTKRFMWR
jgi:hypothetical protein